MSQRPDIRAFFDPATFTVSYIVSDPATRRAAVIDSVMDLDLASGRLSSTSGDAIIAFVKEAGLTVDWILETHVHADHVSAAPYLKAALGGKTAIGFNVSKVQGVFADLFGAESQFRRDGSQFDHLLQDEERFAIGELEARALWTPGHTPACMVYLIGDAGFVGDTLFMPDFGTARCDFPGGDARQLYRSIQKILALPEETRLFMCHDYKAPGREDYAWETTVGAEKANIHLAGVDEDAFIKMRTERDATLAVPRLLLPSVQLNMRAGEKPPAEDNGLAYLKLPLDAL